MTYYKDRPAPPLPDVSVICPPPKKEAPVTGWKGFKLTLKSGFKLLGQLLLLCIAGWLASISPFFAYLLIFGLFVYAIGSLG